MITKSRVALALSTSALCLGVALAPAAFAAGTTTATHAKTKHHKVQKTNAKAATRAPAAKAKVQPATQPAK